MGGGPQSFGDEEMNGQFGDNIAVQVDGHVAVVTLDRPPYNHVSVDFMRDLADAFEAIDGEMEVRCSVLQAQGKGCGPGILGVCIGGDRATGYEFSKQQFLRRLDDSNPNPELDKLERDIVETSNKLGIGPMGFGGKTTLLGTKIGVLNRLPASYFVSISYMCWAFRRQGVALDATGQIQKWLY